MNKHTHFLLLGLLLTLSISAQHFPVPSANPWKDDYRDITGMEHYRSWGTYNVHDPAVMLVGDTYYMYSTDAIYFQRRNDGVPRPDIKPGNIHVRSSKDLVHWKFEGWAFDSIPAEAKQWVWDNNQNKGATNIWAPFPVKYGDKYRLYYCVSAFGLQVSYIGLAESGSPLGPWILKGEVVKTRRGDPMNAIDPSIVTDPVTGKMWMHYGSYFGGLYVMELNPETGRPFTPGDQGVLVARRADYKKDNLEAPEIIYHPGLKKYYLFTSYDPLMTTYNVRVGRSDKPEGPFLDFFGNDLRDTTNNYPIITHPYQFKNHPGWAGVAHCGVFANEKGDFFMAHQGRLSPDNQQMVLHVRELKWTDNGWPVASPQRYAGKIIQESAVSGGGNSQSQTYNRKKANWNSLLPNQLHGHWEIIRIQDAKTDRQLEFGQILWGEGQLRATEINQSKEVELLKNGRMKGSDGKWKYNAKTGLTLVLKNETISNLIVFTGHDWENETETLLFTGLDRNGCSVWGKRVKP
ncbi:MAG: arabinan endo-1,5-alpha-L-arabinosidase [Paludibacteraceae bacterium]|nr:arabinan endo-1,5-alpha-L-arabinosidase [Paludibacteraceae bacterium]